MRERTLGLGKRACAVAMSSLLALCMVPAVALAEPTAADKQAEADAALASLNTLQAELDAAETAYHEAVAAQEEAQAKMDEAQARIDEASERIDGLQEQLGTRARSMYRSGSTSMLDLLLGAATFQEFATTWDLLNQMNQNDADMVKETKELRAEVEEQHAEYTAQEAVAAEKAAEAEQVKNEAEQTVAAMQATYDSLSAEAAELLEQERAAREAAAAAAAAAEIENNRNNNNSNNNTGGTTSKPSTPEPSYNAATGNAIVDRAWGWVGNASYVWGACSPGEFDCSGFVSYCLTGSYSRLGTTYTFMGWNQVSDPQPGDVCVNSGHCGIYIGGGQMIHAATYGVGVVVGGVQSGMIFVRY